MIFRNNTPRWIIFILDVAIFTVSILVAYLLRFNFSIPSHELDLMWVSLPIMLFIRIVIYLFGKTYAGIIRYTSTKDAQRIFMTLAIGSLLFGFVNVYSYNFQNGLFLIPFSVIGIEFLCTSLIMISSRIGVKIIYAEIQNPSKEKLPVVIFGAGEAGVIAKRTIDRDAKSNFKVVSFFDDDTKKTKRVLEGVKIRNGENLADYFTKNEVEILIISSQQVRRSRLNEITEICLQHQVKILNVPAPNTWINGELSFKQIKQVKIDDLLGREEIKLTKDKINAEIKDKIILISGAAGSIGSEIVRQLLRFSPAKLILLDQAESALYEMEMELSRTANFDRIEIVIGDISNAKRMEKLMEVLHPQLIFHAAAYKHVPMMENNPSEAVLTNVKGTKILADLALKFQVEKFVMVSTDKAVNPTNVMGASKRIAEIYTQSLNNQSNTTKFITTRFGNVLGSNGSVIPLFKKQIDNGGPITVTHPDITRYFMTIPEACQLVIEAGVSGKGGEIFIFDMGKSVKIVDLAKKMIELSGLEVDKDIQIVFSGLRPGEKLYEELLNDTENTLPTHHKQIMIAKVRSYNFEEISQKVSHLIQLLEQDNNAVLVKEMKSIVPEYISNNSEFGALDKA